jgi:2-methylcitrate dehydratase PrpD
MTKKTEGFTEKLSAFVVRTESSKIPGWAYDHAKTAFLDWIAVTVGGSGDPLVKKLVRYANLMGGHEQATIIGHGIKRSVSHAALINGSASHALDYDDTLVSFLGHPSVTIFPALLALSEWKEKSGFEFLTAYLIGLQTGGTIGACAGLEHYMAGWHATSTLGHLASAAGCARLLGLNERETVYALGIGGTQSSGLKRVFGTMCKPFHAGRASQSGLMAALLAQDGFTSAEDILEGQQGFFEVLKGSINEDVVALLGFGWDVHNLSQKYHASCHATHSPLEAARTLVNDEKVPLDRIGTIRIFVSKLSMDAAGKMNPETGLEGKFSIPYCVANALIRKETGTRAFTDEKVSDPEVRALMDKVEVTLDEKMTGLEARIEIEDLSGRAYTGFSDILQQTPSLEIKQERIMDKFIDLCEPLWGREKTELVAGTIGDLDGVESMKGFMEAINGHF